MSNPRTSMFTRSLVLSITLAGAGTASADPAGAYATALVGIAGQSDQGLALSGTGPSRSGNAALDSGGLAGGALGWDFGNGWRVEGEFVYQSVDSKVAGLAPAVPDGSGNYASTSVAVNALYTFDLFGSPRSTTYAGIGLVRLTEVDIDIDLPAGERSFSGSDNGIQLLFGARYALGERWYLDAGLRWLRASSLTLGGEAAEPGRIAADYAPWAVTLGLGWRF